MFVIRVIFRDYKNDNNTKYYDLKNLFLFKNKIDVNLFEIS